MNRYFNFLICSFSIFSSCKEEPIPAYINISSISVNTTSSQGSTSSNISDAWVYKDDGLQGGYELPVQFPVIGEGDTRFFIFAGIKLNGISATRAAYPFYAADTINILLESKIADTIFPTVKYTPAAVFDLIENFESGVSFSNMQRSTADVFEGAHSAMFSANDTSEMIAVSIDSYVFPFNTSAVFFEMDYKNNKEFIVGIKAFYGSEGFAIYKLTITPSNEWNKVYVNFTPEVNQLQADSYQVFFSVAPDVNSTSVKILLDNLKLIHSRI